MFGAETMPGQVRKSEVGETEPWFKQRVVEIMNRIIRERGLGFERADAEQSIPVGKKRHLFFDGLLWKKTHEREAVCEMELKRPGLDAADFDLVNNAAQKANAVGAPYFVTWNVRDLWLWRTFEQGKPLLERDCRQWHGIVDVDDVTELKDRDWARIEAFLLELLTELDGLYNRNQQFVGLPVDEIFVRKLNAVVDSHYRVYSNLIRQRCEADRAYYKELRIWTAEHGWTSLLNADVGRTDPEAFEVLGRLAVFLLMNRVIFYKLVRTQHRALPKMTFGDTRTGRQFERKLKEYFESVLQINFETVFSTDVFDELRVPDDSVEKLDRFVSDLDKYDFSTLSFEILGRVYETLIPERERHELGQYFTPPTTVDLINAFCIRDSRDVVLDPACGAGTFLVRAYERLNHLKAKPHRALIEQLWGFEIARFPAHIATINLVLPDLRERENFPYVLGTDAFRVRPENGEFKVPAHKELRYSAKSIQGSSAVMVRVPEFDAVVGNPPYIERRNLRPTERKLIARSITEDWALKEFNQSADIFVYFFVHAGRFLKEGGRLGFVTSNGWLDHRYGADLQTFFLDRFKILAVIESRVERSFSQAEVNTAITIVERCADAKARDENVIRFVSLKRPLSDLLGPDSLRGSEKLVRDVLSATERSSNEDWFVYPVSQTEARESGFNEDREWIGARWGAVYLRAPDVYFTLLERGRDLFARVGQLAEGVLGTKTGCDGFFVRSRVDVTELGLEEKYTRPAFWSPSDSNAFVLDAAAAPDVLVLIAESKHSLRGTNAAKYIAWAEQKKVHTRGECERRANSIGRWYDLSQQVQAGEIAFGKTYNERHAVYFNPDNCVLGARFASFSPKGGVDPELLVALLNSSLTALFIEIFGRTSLGLGALDFAVYELQSIPVIDPRRLDERAQAGLRTAYRKLIQRSPLPLEEEVRSADKMVLDAIVFDSLNLSLDEREAVIKALLSKNAHRLAKAKSVEGSAKASVRAATDDEVLSAGLFEALNTVGLRHFPDDFPSEGANDVLKLEEFAAFEGRPRIEAMMGQGALVWPDGSHVEFATVESAECVALVLALGWTGVMVVPVGRKEAGDLLSALSGYVSAVSEEFQNEVQVISDSEAQVKRVRQLFLPALGRKMFRELEREPQIILEPPAL